MATSFKYWYTKYRRDIGGTVIVVSVFFVLLPYLFNVVVVVALDAFKTRSWVATPGIVSATKIEFHTGLRNNTSSEVKAEYHYRYNGADYTGTRVGLLESGTGEQEWHVRLHNDFKDAMEGHGVITVYVNPDNPSESIVNREIRWMVIGPLLLLIAFGWIFGSWLLYTGWKEALQRPRPMPSLTRSDEPA